MNISYFPLLQSRLPYTTAQWRMPWMPRGSFPLARCATNLGRNLKFLKPGRHPRCDVPAFFIHTTAHMTAHMRECLLLARDVVCACALQVFRCLSLVDTRTIDCVTEVWKHVVNGCQTCTLRRTMCLIYYFFFQCIFKVAEYPFSKSKTPGV